MTTNAQTTKVPTSLYVVLGLVVLFLSSVRFNCKKHFDDSVYSTFSARNVDYQKNDVNGWVLMGMEMRNKEKKQWQIMVVLNHNSVIKFNSINGWSADDRRINILFNNSIIVWDKDCLMRKERIISYEEYLMIRKSLNKYIEEFINELIVKEGE